MLKKSLIALAIIFLCIGLFASGFGFYLALKNPNLLANFGNFAAIAISAVCGIGLSISCLKFAFTDAK